MTDLSLGPCLQYAIVMGSTNDALRRVLNPDEAHSVSTYFAVRCGGTPPPCRPHDPPTTPTHARTNTCTHTRHSRRFRLGRVQGFSRPLLPILWMS